AQGGRGGRGGGGGGGRRRRRRRRRRGWALTPANTNASSLAQDGRGWKTVDK
ncbi:hypothetical protein LZ31DRAFT_628844, partial [Colletotrichum somersetense]